MAATVTHMPRTKRPGLEVHEHSFIRGQRANRRGCTFAHSHEGGDVSHAHPDTGPSSYTIDKDEWAARTGMRGGGRKKFTAEPTGEQFDATIPRTAEQQTFEVIVCDPPKGRQFEGVQGGGLAAAARMALTFKLRPVVKSGGGR